MLHVMSRVAMGSCLIVLLLCRYDRPLAVLRTVRRLPAGGHSVWSDSFTEPTVSGATDSLRPQCLERQIHRITVVVVNFVSCVRCCMY